MTRGRVIFPSKRDWWLTLILVVASIVQVGAGIGMLLGHHSIVLAIGPFAGAAFIWWVMLTTYYVVGETDLLIRCGPLRITILLDEIDRIVPTRDASSSPAMSLDRLRISYHRGGKEQTVMVSPRDKSEFLRQVILEPPKLKRSTGRWFDGRATQVRIERLPVGPTVPGTVYSVLRTAALATINPYPAPRLPSKIFANSSINPSCPALIFRFAVSKSKNSARSISGNSICRPECGGHSIVNVLLRIVAGLQSCSTAQAWTVLPPFCLIGCSGMNVPAGLIPVSSSNSRCAVRNKSSSPSGSPFGIVHEPSSLFWKYGPPG